MPTSKYPIVEMSRERPALSGYGVEAERIQNDKRFSGDECQLAMALLNGEYYIQYNTKNGFE